ncbi:winged helix-turn-helix transcriptional regulator [Actinophytocola oryzae]|uniref:HxlR family transcriptional regulator n=1 Tax=Actinophytocola oryzae TaxID=502181 RepID=A0A4R7UTI3_9PSEU|nr:helix-turn-helix domain-containing protein [Actinophytocola oryzae]TDV39730.1 HxlR family transcriptional regulator [Actinophytocola oryzae]
MRRDPSTLPGRPCSLAAALEVVGDRWALLAVREVAYGNHQFSQIARNTGAPRDRLAARLKDLVAAGVLTKGPGRLDGYHLTDAGRDLGTTMRALLTWGDRWAVTTPPVRLTHHDHELAAKTVCATCGEDVHAADVGREVLVPGWTQAGPGNG